MSNRRIILAALTVAMAATALAQTPPKPAATSEPVLARFPLDIQAGVVMLPVDFNGQRLAFFLDTGATHMVFDESLRDQLGPQVRSQRVMTAGGFKDMPVYAAPAAKLGPMDLSDGAVALVSDFAAVRKLSGKDIRGAIGNSALKKFVIRVDVDAKEVVILNPDGRVHEDWGAVLPLTFSLQGMPMVRGRLDANTELDFVIDTGATATGHLPQDIFRQVMSANGLASTQTSVESARGSRTELLARVPSLTVGPYEHKGLVFTSSPTLALLGCGYLLRYNTTVDFPAKRLYLARSRHFEHPDEILICGFHISHSGGNVVIDSVDKGGPAERAGIVAGDVLLGVDGKNTTTMDISEINALLRQADKRLAVIICRGKKIYQVSILLKQPI